MPTLYHTLGVGADALRTTRQGVDTAGHNIANAQTEGYSRQRINVRSRDPLDRNGILIGNGVYVGNIGRSHDEFVEKQINNTNNASGAADARYQGLQALEVVFSPEFEASVADELSNFFNAVQSLAAFPEDFTVRTNVVEAGRNLTSALEGTDRALKQQQADFNDRVLHTTHEINDRLQAIAGLNVRIRAMETGNEGQEANDLRDQRDKLLRETTKLVDVNYYEDQYGMVMVRGPKEVTLVDGGNSATVEVARNVAGQYDVLARDWEGKRTRNLTDGITSGTLKGYLELRDEIVPGLLEKNDQMAYALASEFNKVHRQGYGLKNFGESTGRNFFNNIEHVKGAAAGIQIDDAIIESTDAISAASSPLAPGDNVVVNQLLKIKEAPILANGNITLNEFYANYVGELGLEVVRAEHIKDANDILLADLSKKREAVSGVSLDEEAMSLLRWQSNFTAASKVITTVDEMLETVLSLKR